MAKGYILSETDERVIVATLYSENVKTGNMVKIYILPRNEAPHYAIKSGQDELVCGDCKQRPINGGACYVLTFQGPLQVWKCYKAGKYPFLSKDQYHEAFQGREIRLGEYGDPYFIDMGIVAALAHVSKGRFTGYTHQWKRPDAAWLRPYCMASVDTLDEQIQAKLNGWRTFRVRPKGSQELGPTEILCLNTTHGVQCRKCLLCSGKSKPMAKDVVVDAHGAKAKRFAA